MKTFNQLTLSLLSITMIMFLFTSCEKDPVIEPGEASIITFSIDGENATIDEGAKTITMKVSPSADITQLAPTIVVSTGATVSPASGEAVDFTNPVTYTVTDKSETVTNNYTVTVTQDELKHMAFVGWAPENTVAAWAALNGTDYTVDDDRTAAEWFFENMTSDGVATSYFSFEDVAGGADLSEFDVVWIQFDGGWWGGEVAQFPNNGNHCILMETGIGFDVPCDDLATNFANSVKAYYEAGGNLLLGNFAGSMVDEIGVVSSPDFAPNNAFGGVGVDEGATDGAWGARWAYDATSPLFKDVITDTDPNCAAPFFMMLISGTEKRNRSNQYNLNFGPWAPNGDADPLEDRRNSWLDMVGGIILMENCGENEPQAVMWESDGTKGTVIAYLGGLYDWYTGDTVDNIDNIQVLTRNALNYLSE